MDYFGVYFQPTLIDVFQRLNNIKIKENHTIHDNEGNILFN